MTTMSITSIIPGMIVGIILIIAWIPMIVISERNDKKNNDEYKSLLDDINNDLILTDVTSQTTYPTPISGIPTTYYNSNISSDFMKNINNNCYIIVNKTVKTSDTNGNISSNTTFNFANNIINPPLVNNVVMSNDNYIYLALQNKLTDLTNTTTDPNDNTISYELIYYNIPNNKIIMNVEGLQDKSSNLDVKIYDYEFGPADNVKNTIINRKDKADKVQMWIGRIVSFLILFAGLSLLVSPLRFIVNAEGSLPGILKFIAIPGQIVLNLYETLSFFGAIILTTLMTFFVWSIFNYPLISVLIGGLLVGLILYFK
jgi:hypothetical protein